MDGYEYPYTPSFSQMRGSPPGNLDHGDGYGEYYDMGPVNDRTDGGRPSRTKHQTRKRDKRSRPRSSSTRSKSRSTSRSKSRSSRSRSRSRSGNHQLKHREPSILDAFRVLYLTPSGHRKSTTKYLSTRKRQDRIQEILKSDGLGSKHWIFYPRNVVKSESCTTSAAAPEVRESDQRVKLDGDFFRDYKRNRKVDNDSPIAKLKRWELILYYKLGFVQAV